MKKSRGCSSENVGNICVCVQHDLIRCTALCFLFVSFYLCGSRLVFYRTFHLFITIQLNAHCRLIVFLAANIRTPQSVPNFICQAIFSTYLPVQKAICTARTFSLMLKQANVTIYLFIFHFMYSKTSTAMKPEHMIIIVLDFILVNSICST